MTRYALLAALLVPSAAFAQDRSALLLPIPTPPGAMGAATGRAQPGVSASSPLAFGPNFRDVFVGFGYQAETRYGGDDDGSVSVGAGFGNSMTMVGLEAVITSLSTVRGGFGERMVGSIKLHRNLPRNAAIGVGIEGFKLAGDNFETTESFFVALSKVARLSNSDYFSAITLNGGIGNGRFRSEDDFIDDPDGDGINVFASAGLRVAPWLGAIADWTGQDLNIGASLALLPNIPIVITPAIADVLEQAGDGARFTLGAGLSWRF